MHVIKRGLWGYIQSHSEMRMLKIELHHGVYRETWCTSTSPASALRGTSNTILSSICVKLSYTMMYTNCKNRCTPHDELWCISTVQKPIDDLTSYDTASHTSQARQTTSGPNTRHGVT